MSSIHIDTAKLTDLGATWERAAFNPGVALTTFGLVGFTMDKAQNFFTGMHDRFALRESFTLCGRFRLPVGRFAEARVINADPRQGGVDILRCHERVDALIFSRIPMISTEEMAKLYRTQAESLMDYTMWTSPELTHPAAYQDAAARLHVKAAFFFGADDRDLNTRQFELPGTPYRTLKPTAQESDAYGIKIFRGLVLHSEYARRVEIHSTPLKPALGAVAELKRDDIRLQRS